MSLITCSRNCIYQKNGYCKLEKAAAVTNVSGGCPHFVLYDKTDKIKASNIVKDYFIK